MIAPHYRFDVFSTVRTKTLELQVVTLVVLYAHAANKRTFDRFGHRFHFDAFSPSTLIR